MAEYNTTPSGRVLADLVGVLHGHTSSVDLLRFSPDGRLLASSGRNGQVCLWDVAQQQQIAVIPGLENAISDISFSPDGLHLATGGEAADGKNVVQVWSRQGALMQSLSSGQEEGIRNNQFSPDGQFIVAGFRTGSILVWTAANGTLVTQLKGHTGDVTELAFSPDGRLLVTGDLLGWVRVWQVGSWQLLHQFVGMRRGKSRKTGTVQPHHWVGPFLFTPNGQRLAFPGPDNQGQVQIWDLPTSWYATPPTDANPRWITSLIDPSHTPVRALTFSPNDTLLAVADHGNPDVPAPQQQSAVQVFDGQTLAPVASLLTPDDFPALVGFSADGQVLAYAAAAGQLWFWDVAHREVGAMVEAFTRAWDYRLGAPMGQVDALAWSPTQPLIAVSGMDPDVDDPTAVRRVGRIKNTIRLWEVVVV